MDISRLKNILKIYNTKNKVIINYDNRYYQNFLFFMVSLLILTNYISVLSRHVIDIGTKKKCSYF